MAMLFPIQWNEPFGLVMVEAMACGTPVLALSVSNMTRVRCISREF
jgi:glycosyltransferase involved in cell wall biosynthesis